MYICQGGVIIKNKLNRDAKCWFSLKATRALTSYTVILNLINNSFLIKGYQTWFAILATCNEKITQPDGSLLILDIRTELQHLTALFSQPVSYTEVIIIITAINTTIVNQLVLCTYSAKKQGLLSTR